MHFSEFMDEDGPGMIISAGSLRACLDAQVKHVAASRAAFCDFAAGGDENVIAIADGNKAELIRCWRDTDPIRLRVSAARSRTVAGLCRVLAPRAAVQRAIGQ